MTEVFYCKKLLNDLKSFERGSNEKAIRKLIDLFLHRNDLKSIGKVSAKKENFYFFKISDYNCNIVIEKKTVLINNRDINVHFLQELIQDKTLNGEQGRIFQAKYLDSNWLLKQTTSDENISLFKKEYLANQNKDKKEVPSDSMTGWFSESKLKLKNNVFESQEWVEYSLNPNSECGLSDYHIYSFRKLIQKSVSLDIEFTTSANINGIDIFEASEDNVSILFSIIESQDEQYFLLHCGAHIPTQLEYWKFEKEKLALSDLLLDNTRENISRNSYRSYPSWTLNNDDTWYPIQKSDEYSNLSLTEEQSQFLTNFTFPHYINGQAGSGKSTLLYYIYANILFLKSIVDEKIGNIIFLTENKKLLENTKEYVHDLLKNNPEFGIEDELEKINFNDSFNYFQSFLLNMLDSREKKMFPKEYFLNFSKFKEEYSASNISNNIKDKFSAEESWFTIITYIYGYNSDILITSDNYESEVPQKSRTSISLETFKEIEKHILPLYNNLIKNGYWGKLELIKYINSNIDAKALKKYTVIICDEAQDFCRVELQFILKMSKFLEYDLSRTQQVPVLFAGDPNQTVNPTGFRQDEMTSLLHSILLDTGKFKSENCIGYSPRLNYRSSHPVVNLANIIQYYRIKNLDIKQQYPQEAKRPVINKDENFNLYISNEDIETNPALKKDLLKKLEYKVFIIPGDESDKQEIKRNSNILSSINNVDIKTSVEAKGAEYKQVVIIGFGDYFIKHFGNLNSKVSSQVKFRIDYFFNKLYVAITRAQNELLIIDSKEAQSRFWQNMITSTTVSSASSWSDLNTYINETILFDSESLNTLIKTSNKEDALVNANQDKKEGLNHENPARLKVAANQFSKLGDNDQYNECLAYAELFKFNYKSSAEYFIKADEIGLAASSFFKGAYFEDLERLGLGTGSTIHKLQSILSKIMNDISINHADLLFIKKNKSETKELIEDVNWKDEFITKLIQKTKLSQDELLLDYTNVLNSIASPIDKNIYEYIAEVFYEFEDYKAAIKAWKHLDSYHKIEKYNHAEYTYANECSMHDEVAIWADALCYFNLDKDVLLEKYCNKILKLYRNNKLNLQDSLVLNSIYNAHFHIRSYTEILEFGKVYESSLSNSISTHQDFYENILNRKGLEKTLYIFALERYAKSIWKNLDDYNEDILDEINEYNETISHLYHIPFKLFSKNELDSMANYPEDMSENNNLHLTQVSVRDFRKYKELELSNLGQFNLILGDNNVGKTSLLESLLVSTDIDQSIINLYFSYVARENSYRYKEKSKDFYNVPNDFLLSYCRKDAKNNTMNFTLEQNRSIDEVEIKMTEHIDKSQLFNEINMENEVQLTINGIVQEPLNMSSLSIPASSMMLSQLIPFSKGFDKDLIKMYEDKIGQFKSKRIEFIKAMKIFIPSIEYIKIDTSNSLILVEELMGEIASPLTHYGEGANKLFRILVQIAMQEGKKLLIDEIDAGIHYSHYLSFWTTIIMTASQYNVQLFITTHNIECLEYLYKALEKDGLVKHQVQTRLITLLSLPNGEAGAFTREYEEFEHAIKVGSELRGGK